jgi:hypothetical protein
LGRILCLFILSSSCYQFLVCLHANLYNIMDLYLNNLMSGLLIIQPIKYEITTIAQSVMITPNEAEVTSSNLSLPLKRTYQKKKKKKTTIVYRAYLS